jgi:hypothetical protein
VPLLQDDDGEKHNQEILRITGYKRCNVVSIRGKYVKTVLCLVALCTTLQTPVHKYAVTSGWPAGMTNSRRGMNIWV